MLTVTILAQTIISAVNTIQIISQRTMQQAK